jgi:aspartyl/asparaginyl beta-hydroxylase
MMRDLDDSNEREVWNDTDSYRVVLFVDFVRPTVFPLSMVNRAIIWGRGRSRGTLFSWEALWFVSN